MKQETMDRNHGYIKVGVVSPPVYIGDPENNANSIISELKEHTEEDIVVFPELCLTGYTCADLFRQEDLIQRCLANLERISSAHYGIQQLVFIGLPVVVGNKLFNCALAMNRGRFLGIVPKQNVPNYSEFYESRWFHPGTGNEPKEIDIGYWKNIPFGTDLLFQCSDAVVSAEICEDLWMAIPPSSHAALAGANIIVNLSASNETVGKADYRKQLVVGQSGRCISAYVYASAGQSESTTDLVFGGHCMIAENNKLLAESDRVGQNINTGSSDPNTKRFISTHVDVQQLQTERRITTTFGNSIQIVPSYRYINFFLEDGLGKFERRISANPFVPEDRDKLKSCCDEILDIQCTGLMQRLDKTGITEAYIGVSGGLDSTLSLLVAVNAFKRLDLPLDGLHGITMPGFGTTDKTLYNSRRLMDLLGIASEVVDIRESSLQAFRDLNHEPFGIHPNMDLEDFEKQIKSVNKIKGDLVFENVQARMRTFVLMSKGFVVGTGDLSELALGWCTFNGDHMSMYNPNCSVPKTLVKSLINHLIDWNTPEGEVLGSILNTTISPELLPKGNDGEIEQSTEDTLGPYELHDFFLYHFVRNGFSPEKIAWLAQKANESRNQEYSNEKIRKTLGVFLERFMKNQFKRSTVPDGPKVGSVSLSPRGDWRMPSDAETKPWIRNFK